MTPLEQINDLHEVAEYMDDSELSEALGTVAAIILQPNIPASSATIEIVRLQAIALKLQMKATWLANVDKSDRPRKNLYYSAAAEIDKVVSALKYTMKN